MSFDICTGAVMSLPEVVGEVRDVFRCMFRLKGKRCISIYVQV